jgi:hypothetical protein
MHTMLIQFIPVALARLFVCEYNPAMFDNEKSIPNPDSNEVDNLLSLEAAFSDPQLKRSMDLASTWNDVLKDQKPSLEEKQLIITELDTSLGEIFRSPVRFTGLVDVTRIDGSDPVSALFLDDAEVVHYGYNINDATYLVGGETVVTGTKVVIQLQVPYELAYSDSDQDEQSQGVKTASVVGFSDLDKAYIEWDSASAEHARAWLTTFCPDLIEELDTVVMNAEGSEDDSVCALSMLDLKKYPQLDEAFARECLLTYLNEVIAIDSWVPYRAEVEGEMYNGVDNERSYIVSNYKALVYIQPIGMKKYFNEELNEAYWKLLVPFGIIHESPKKPISSMLVPVESIKSLESIRRTHFLKS